MLRRLYDWVLHWAETPYGTWALFLLAFAESSFFPIPPDVLLIALALSIPAKSFRYALICTVGSVMGGAVGYLIGYEFMGLVGDRIIAAYGLTEAYRQVGEMYNRWNAIAVAIAGFTPIPYKLFTIAGGAFRINFPVFIIASLLSRAARFYLVGLLIYHYGEAIKSFIDRYFNLLALLFAALLVGGFILIAQLM